MRVLLISVLVAVAVYAALLAVLLMAGRGTAARELATLVPNLARLFKDLIRDPRVPRGSKVLLVIAAAWVASPIDLIPEFIPVLGPLDDAVVAALVLRHVLRRAGRDVVEEHWRGDPATLRRLLRLFSVTGSREGVADSTSSLSSNGGRAMNLNSVLIGSEHPQELADYYSKLFGKAGWESGDFVGWQIGTGWMVVGPHDQVKGTNAQPGRIIWNLETADVRGDFESMKAAGATVVQEPYAPGEAPDGLIATFSDPDDNYFQLVSPMEM